MLSDGIYLALYLAYTLHHLSFHGICNDILVTPPLYHGILVSHVTSIYHDLIDSYPPPDATVTALDSIMMPVLRLAPTAPDHMLQDSVVQVLRP